MSRTNQETTEVESTEVINTAEVETTEVIETKPATTDTKAIVEKDVVTGKTPVTNVAVKVAIEPSKKIGIVRYLQLHPTGNKTLDRTLTKLFGSEVHTESEWEKIIIDFLNS